MLIKVRNSVIKKIIENWLFKNVRVFFLSKYSVWFCDFWKCFFFLVIDLMNCILNFFCYFFCLIIDYGIWLWKFVEEYNNSFCCYGIWFEW